MKKLILVVTEGEKTEPNYFRELRNKNLMDPTLSLIIHHCRGGSANDLVEKMEYMVTKDELEPGDQTWIVADDDKRAQKEINLLLAWRKSDILFNWLAISNPSFEFWLLLHFDCNYSVIDQKDCEKQLENQLKKELNNKNFEYKKEFPTKFITLDKILVAISRAENRDNTSQEKWPDERSTRVYNLLKVLLTA